jgi:hypothetical protein
LLANVPYEELPVDKVKLPKRKVDQSKTVNATVRVVSERY